VTSRAITQVPYNFIKAKVSLSREKCGGLGRLKVGPSVSESKKLENFFLIDFFFFFNTNFSNHKQLLLTFCSSCLHLFVCLLLIIAR
jgi:hypothetical protein